MPNLRYAALAAVLLALAGCTDKQLNSSITVLEGEPDPELHTAALVEPVAASSVEPSYGPMGEEIDMGPNCVPVFRVRICQ